MTAASAESEGELLTVDELAAATGLTVRTTRYYAGLGLLPPPVRRGRVAYYGPRHRARLELVCALQEHGFTLAAVERYLARIPAEAGAEELALQRSMLTSWSSGPGESLTRTQLQRRAGRRLSDDDLELLVRVQGVRRHGDRFETLPGLGTAIEVLELDIPTESMVAATASITAHMDALADELTGIMREQVLAPFREEPRSPQEQAVMEQTVARLRRLTLEAVVASFQRAANQVISRSLERDARDQSST